MTCTSVLTVKDLHIALEKGEALYPLVKGLSFAVGRGEVLGLIGQSGCGKSITCLSLLDLLPAGLRRTRGEVWLNGTSISQLTAPDLRSHRGQGAAMILQNPMSCFNPIVRIRHHFLETLDSHRLTDPDRGMQRVRESLDEMGFTNPEEILGLYPFQMSGGMLQRVMIALALSLEAPLLIADEPTTDLDVLSQDRILNLLRGLRDKHEMGILLVTHDLGVIASLADTVAVMEDGEIVETGSVAQIFSEPVHPFTKMLLKAHFGLYGVFADIPALREGMRQR
ncbi:MAG: ABC transporter ATP-binding protein [Desulfobacterota bacterium]|jgi:nickel transport system ATP-binding protein|nr:ABC transporter ATP-binding protein [Thermodesulfobacteriota bacterium]